MSCGGRVWKGDTITISVPFDVSGYTDLTISYYTDGEVKVVKSESDVEIEDGFITYTFLPGELDTIADGVIRYQIDYSVDNVDYVTGTNTMSYLKTPKTYSAKTTEEYYEEGFSSGYTQGEEVGYASGHTDGYTEGEIVGKTEGYVSGYTQGEQVGYSQGYEEGHAQGKQDGEEVGYDNAVSDIRNQSISLSVSANGTYSANTEDSIYFNEVLVDVPCSSSSGGCNLLTARYGIDGNWDGQDRELTPFMIGYGDDYDGFSALTIYDDGYGQIQRGNGFDSGFTEGRLSGYQSGYTEGINYQKSLLTDITIENNGTYSREDGYNRVNVSIPNINDYDFAIGFHGACTFYIHDDNDFWDRSDNTTKLGYYISELYVPEDNYICEFDEMDMKQSFTMSFSGDGYHMVWFYLNNDIGTTHFDWAGVRSGGTYVDIDFVYPSEVVLDINPFFPNNQYNSVSISRYPQTSEDAVMRFLYEH